MSLRMNRRQMIQTSGAAAAGYWLAQSTSPVRASSPNEKLNVAVVGCGGRGGSNLGGVSGENVVALCDVDDRRAAGGFGAHPNAKKFKDFRRMLDAVHGEIDAVVVSTPDHTHAPAAITAMSLGKHCYCEKPLAHTVEEVRKMTELAKKNNLATQMGTQIHAGANYRRVVELVQSGAIGTVEEVHVWHPVAYGGMDRPTETPDVPEGLDWNLWLGPAPVRPYHPNYVPTSWRYWWDFGCGGLGDFGCHYMDLPFWALKLAHPIAIAADGPAVHPESTSPGLRIKYEFPARGDLPPAKMVWYDAGRKPDFLEEKGVPGWSAAVLFLGSEGMLISDYSKHALLPESKFADFTRPEPTIPASIGHHAEWIAACKSGTPTTCNFGYSGPLSETVLLGNLAYRCGSTIKWDAENLKPVDCPAAEEFLSKEYREGWEL
jgi:predicted dehydrogenase